MVANVTPQLTRDLVMDDGRRRVAEDTNRKPARFGATSGDVDDDLGVVSFASKRHRDDFQIRGLLARCVSGNARDICNGEWLHLLSDNSQAACPGSSGGGGARLRSCWRSAY